MIRRLPIESATPRSVAPYGTLVAADQVRAPRTGVFYGDAVQLWSQDRFVSDADTCLTVARVHPRDNEVVWMERHFKHTQTFVPLGGRPFVMVLGAPTTGSAPDPSDVRALFFDGQAGFMMHIGTWHEFPFAIDQTTDMLVILRKETVRNLDVSENDEVEGDDLEKRNMRTCLGFTFGF